MDDIALLIRLSQVRVELHRCRGEAATAATRLRQRRARVAQARALLRADSLALATARDAGEPDQVTAEVLGEALAGSLRDQESASRRAVRSIGAFRPLLARLSAASEGLEEEAANLRAKLSPLAVRALEILERKAILPLVASLDEGACGECHLCVPTALASAVGASRAIQRCPHCKRILVARDRTI
jgi:predicted  nucleic acid-binding Zn-ribbon protein